MRDLELWRRIERGEVTPDELAPLVAWPLARRAAHVGRIAPLASHPDPAMRQAALAVLAGVRGVPGVRLLVGALGDSELDVASAAVRALRQTAAMAPVRYAHALFHPRLEVRRLALADVPHGALHAAAHLRADPDCADLAAARSRRAMPMDLGPAREPLIQHLRTPDVRWVEPIP